MMNYLLVGIGGFAGALIRYAVSGWFSERLADGGFPWGTLVVNITGSLLLGFLSSVAIERGVMTPETRLALMVGLLGAYTTFSTWSLETVNLLRAGSVFLAAVNAAGSLIAGLTSVWLGIVLGKLV